MRFHILVQSGQDPRFRRVPVTGTRIDFPQYPTELFAASANPCVPTKGEPAYIVTHIGTGFRIATGKNESGAIAAARKAIADKSPDEFWKAGATARQYIKACKTLS